MAGTRIAGFKGYILEVSSHVGGPSLPAHPTGIEHILAKYFAHFIAENGTLIFYCASH